MDRGARCDDPADVAADDGLLARWRGVAWREHWWQLAHLMVGRYIWAHTADDGPLASPLHEAIGYEEAVFDRSN